MIKIFILTYTCFILIACGNEARVDYNKEPYQALREVLGHGGIENPDACDDKVQHITASRDSVLGKMVHQYSLHVNRTYKDGDRCNGDYSRQRCETSVQGTSPAWMKGYKGMTFTYAWKLFLDKDFKQSGKFCHLHQIKLDGGNVGTPNLTLTARDAMQL